MDPGVVTAHTIRHIRLLKSAGIRNCIAVDSISARVWKHHFVDEIQTLHGMFII